MAKAFISMPGILKQQSLGTLIEDSLELVYQTQGIHYKEGFSTYKYLEANQGLGRINKASEFLIGPFRRLYWDITMHACIKELRKHDAVLGILPEPVRADGTSFSLGVANEFAEAFSNNIPLYITTFDVSSKEITGIYRPKKMMDVLQELEITSNLYEYLARSPQLFNQLQRPNEKTKPDYIYHAGGYIFGDNFGRIS